MLSIIAEHFLKIWYNNYMKNILILIALLLLGHFFGIKGLYYSTSYFDDLLHFFSGVMLAMLAFYFFPKIKIKTSVINILIFILIIVVFWEVHEYFWYTFLSPKYKLPTLQLGTADTVLDSIDAFTGGIAYMFYKKRHNFK